ncbi:MAG: TonB family protein [Paludibacteraceae bacterium]|nr:TonB family protein [Paludibacteraceae bacterium]
MKRFFLFLMAAILLQPMFADSYHDALGRYLQYTENMNTENYTEALHPLVGQLFAGNQERAKQAMDNYASEQLMDDLIEVVKPFFQEHVSENDLSRLVDIYTDPNYTQMARRVGKALDEYRYTPEYKNFNKQFEKAIKQLAKGKKPKNLELPKTVTEKYYAQFLKYYTASRAEETPTPISEEMTRTSYAKKLRNEGAKDPDAVVPQVVDYVQANMPIVLVSVFNASFTENDLQQLTEAAEIQPFVSAAVAPIEAIPNQIGGRLITMMTEWMMARYPEKTEMLQSLRAQADGWGYPTKGEVYKVVDQLPEFPGGTAKMYEFINQNVWRPDDDGFHGKGVYQIIINRDGSISDFTILRSSGNEFLDIRTKYAVESMPQWTPGRLGNEIVRAQLTLPIKYQFAPAYMNDVENEDEPLFVVVEQMPQFPGGQQAMSQFLSETVKYPVVAYENNIQGRVIVQFVVNKDGSISDVEVVRSGGDPSLDKEAVRVVKYMPKWRPGKQKGNPVRVKYTMPVTFSIKAAQKQN